MAGRWPAGVPHRIVRLALWLVPGVCAMPACLAGQTVVQRSSWYASLTADQGWDSNVRFESDSARISDFNRSLSANGRIIRARARTTLGLGARASISRYDKLKGLNTVSYDVNSNAVRRLSANTAGSVGAYYRNVLTTSAVTTPTALLYQRALQKSYGGNVGVLHKFSPFNLGNVDLGYSSSSFDLPGLIPGRSFTGRGQFTHQLRTRGAIGLIGDVSQGNAGTVTLGTQSLALLVTPRLKKIRFAATGGVTRAVTDSASALLFSGGVQVGDSIGPGSFAFGYSRRASEATGLGALLVTDAVSASYDFQARRGNFVTLGGWYGRSKPSTGPGFSLTTRSLFASFNRVLKAGITINGTGSYRQRKDLIRASGFGAQAGLGYTFSPR